MGLGHLLKGISVGLHSYEGRQEETEWEQGGIISGCHMGVMNERKAETNKDTREYLPTLASFSQKTEPSNGKRVRRTPKAKGKKLGKKLWREYYEMTNWIRNIK